MAWGEESPAWDQGLVVGPSDPMLDLARCLRPLKSEEEQWSLSPIASEQPFKGVQAVSEVEAVLMDAYVQTQQRCW